MRLPVLVCLAMLLAPSAVSAQRGQEDAAGRSRVEARRDSLEREVVQKFVDRLARDLSLGAEQRSRTERVLVESGVRRRELMRESSALRVRIHRAVRVDTASEATFTSLLAEHDALRAREHDLWRREQDELARVLSPRQRAQFLIAWAHFQNEMREITLRRAREQGRSRPDVPPDQPPSDGS